jgi:hypothetical protein
MDDVLATSDKQEALVAPFETTRREEGTCQFMAPEHEALSAILVMWVDVARREAETEACATSGEIEEEVQMKD